MAGAPLALLVGVLAGIAVAVLLDGGAGLVAGPARRRLALLIRAAAPGLDGDCRSYTLARLAAAACACGIAAASWGALGPAFAAAAGLAAGVVGARVLRAVLERGAADAQRNRDQLALRRELPPAVDLLAACLVAGCAPVPALVTVARAVGAPLNRHLAALAAGLAGPVTGPVADGMPEAMRPVARIMRRAHVAGAPAADALARLADDMRAATVADVRAGIARLGVRAVLPLGLCFLPAFVLLGVVPVAVGLLHTMW